MWCILACYTKNVKKFVIQLVLLLIVIFLAMYYSFRGGVSPFSFNNQEVAASNKLQVGETLLNIEVADTPKLRQQGLGGKDQIASDSGMLFIFSEVKKHQFWMKNMKFPIDMIFIREGLVVDILRNVPPPQANTADSALSIYQPVVAVDQVLEVNANFASTHGIKVGDKVMLVDDGDTDP